MSKGGNIQFTALIDLSPYLLHGSSYKVAINRCTPIKDSDDNVNKYLIYGPNAETIHDSAPFYRL